MTLDPHLAPLVAVVMAIAWTMCFGGLAKGLLEQRRRTRICPSCGRRIAGPVCREH